MTADENLLGTLALEQLACTLQRAVDSGDGVVEELRYVTGTTEHIAEHEHRTLFRRQQQHRRDERELETSARLLWFRLDRDG